MVLAACLRIGCPTTCRCVPFGFKLEAELKRVTSKSKDRPFDLISRIEGLSNTKADRILEDHVPQGRFGGCFLFVLKTKININK